MGKYEEALERARQGLPMDEVFPELKGSEDERIIEMIIDCLNRAVDVKYISLADRGKCLSYIEKRKEEIDRRREMVEQHCKNVDELGEKIKSLQKKLYGKQKEQKPSEKQDYSGLTDLERAIHRGFLAAAVENVSVTLIKETAYDCLAQMKSAEWSEEDEEIREEVIGDLCALKDWIVKYDVNWLANPVLKSIDKRISWLKALHSDSYKNCNSRWKPSDEHPEGGYSEKPNDLLSEAAKDSWTEYEYRESPKGLYSTCYVDGFEAGAKWVAGQGITFEGKATRKYVRGWGGFFSCILFDEQKAANLLVEQGKEADIIINIRKKQPGESLKEKEDESK